MKEPKFRLLWLGIHRAFVPASSQTYSLIPFITKYGKQTCVPKHSYSTFIPYTKFRRKCTVQTTFRLYLWALPSFVYLSNKSISRKLFNAGTQPSYKYHCALTCSGIRVLIKRLAKLCSIAPSCWLYPPTNTGPYTHTHTHFVLIYIYRYPPRATNISVATPRRRDQQP